MCNIYFTTIRVFNCKSNTYFLLLINTRNGNIVTSFIDQTIHVTRNKSWRCVRNQHLTLNNLTNKSNVITLAKTVQIHQEWCVIKRGYFDVWPTGALGEIFLVWWRFTCYRSSLPCSLFVMLCNICSLLSAFCSNHEILVVKMYKRRTGIDWKFIGWSIKSEYEFTCF